MTNYTVTMDDNTKVELKAWSASDAIQVALTRRLGHKVSACESGMGMAQLRGKIEYEIPNHVALTAKPSRPKKTDNTVAMFDSEEIRKESEYAKYRRDIDKLIRVKAAG